MVVPEVISLERERYATLMQKLTNPLAMLASDHEYVKGVFTKCLNTDSLAHEVRLTIALPVN